MPNVEPLREGDPATVGPYRLVGRLGAGGHGVVYLGQARNGTPVAVKVLREGLSVDGRLATEIAAARKVEPFCLAQVLDASTSGRPYIVSEYVDGPSLQQVGRLGGAELQRLAVATATALDAIHQAGVVHGDFKPANVLIGPDGPRVVDFGIAGALGTGVKATGTFVGTPAYMAPEQLAGQAGGAASDVFAWGSVMVSAATGVPPFGDDSLPAVINRILKDEPRMGELRGPVREILLACLAKDPGSRPAMRDVLLRLTAPSRQQTAPYQTQPHRPDPPLAAWQDTPDATLDQDTPPRRARTQEPAAEQPAAPLPRRTSRQSHGTDPQSLGRPVAGQPVSGQPVAGQPVAGQPVVGQPAPPAHHGQGPHFGQNAPAHLDQGQPFGQAAPAHVDQGPHFGQGSPAHFDQGAAAHHQGATAPHGQGPGTFPMAAPVEAPVPPAFQHHAPAEPPPGFPPAEGPGAAQVVAEPSVAQHSALVDLLVPGTPQPQAPPQAPEPPRRSGRRRVKIVLVAGVAGVSVLALAGAIMWLTPTTPTPKAKNVSDVTTAPTTEPTAGAATTPTTRPRRSRTPRPSPQTVGTPSNVPTAGSTTDSTGDPTGTPTASATPAAGRLRLVYVRPGGAKNGDCWTGGEVTLQAMVQRTGLPLTFRYTWYIDNVAVGRSSALVTENGQRFLTSPQSLKSTGGVHRVTLRITSPVATQRTISVTMCDRGTY